MASRAATAASAVLAGVVGAAYLALTWDGWLANFQVRWMCDEDRPYKLQGRTGVTVLGLHEDTAGGDARALDVFGESYPEVIVVGARAAARPRYELVQLWPTVLRDYWGFRVVRTDLSVVDRGDNNRVLGVSGLFARVERGGGRLRALRDALAPPAQRCAASDRVEFVKGVLRPPD